METGFSCQAEDAGQDLPNILVDRPGMPDDFAGGDDSYPVEDEQHAI